LIGWGCGDTVGVAGEGPTDVMLAPIGDAGLDALDGKDSGEVIGLELMEGIVMATTL